MGLCAGTDQSVMLVLADKANDSGESWPSVDELMERTGRKRRAVLYALARLERHGFIVRDRRNGQRTHYWIQETSASTCTRATFAPVQPDAHTSASTCTRPVQLSAHRTINETSLNRHSSGEENLEPVQTDESQSVTPLPPLARGHLTDLLASFPAEVEERWKNALYVAERATRNVDASENLIHYLHVYCRKRKLTPTPEGFITYHSRGERMAVEGIEKAKQQAQAEAGAPRKRRWDEEGMAL